jgi:hypothetical protein
MSENRHNDVFFQSNGDIRPEIEQGARQIGGVFVPDSFDVGDVPGYGGPSPEYFPQFAYEDEKADLYDQCATVGDYMHDNGVTALALIDRSARPAWVGIKQYIASKYGEDYRPDIFFLNPDGFKGIRPDAIDSDHPYLAAHRRSPVLVFDTCIHDGSTLEPIMAGLKEAGFDGVRAGVVNRGIDSNCDIKLDLLAVKDSGWLSSCYPFSGSGITISSLVDKSSDRVYSNPSDISRRQKQTQYALRREIRQVIKDEHARRSDRSFLKKVADSIGKRRGPTA